MGFSKKIKSFLGFTMKEQKLLLVHSYFRKLESNLRREGYA